MRHHFHACAVEVKLTLMSVERSGGAGKTAIFAITGFTHSYIEDVIEWCVSSIKRLLHNTPESPTKLSAVGLHCG